MKDENKLNKPVGWGLLRENLPDMVAYVALMAFLILVRPPLYITILVLISWAAAKMILTKTFTWKRFGKSAAFIFIFLCFIYAIYYYVSGTWALIIAHVSGVTMIAIGRWRFIKKCDAQIKQQLDVIINKRNGDDK